MSDDDDPDDYTFKGEDENGESHRYRRVKIHRDGEDIEKLFEDGMLIERKEIPRDEYGQTKDYKREFWTPEGWHSEEVVHHSGEKFSSSDSIHRYRDGELVEKEVTSRPSYDGDSSSTTTEFKGNDGEWHTQRQAGNNTLVDGEIVGKVIERKTDDGTEYDYEFYGEDGKWHKEEDKKRYESWGDRVEEKLIDGVPIKRTTTKWNLDHDPEYNTEHFEGKISSYVEGLKRPKPREESESSTSPEEQRSSSYDDNTSYEYSPESPSEEHNYRPRERTSLIGKAIGVLDKLFSSPVKNSYAEQERLRVEEIRSATGITLPQQLHSPTEAPLQIPRQHEGKISAFEKDKNLVESIKHMDPKRFEKTMMSLSRADRQFARSIRNSVPGMKEIDDKYYNFKEQARMAPASTSSGKPTGQYSYPAPESESSLQIKRDIINARGAGKTKGETDEIISSFLSSMTHEEYDKLLQGLSSNGKLIADTARENIIKNKQAQEKKAASKDFVNSSTQGIKSEKEVAHEKMQQKIDLMRSKAEKIERNPPGLVHVGPREEGKYRFARMKKGK